MASGKKDIGTGRLCVALFSRPENGNFEYPDIGTNTFMRGYRVRNG